MELMLTTLSLDEKPLLALVTQHIKHRHIVVNNSILNNRKHAEDKELLFR